MMRSGLEVAAVCAAAAFVAGCTTGRGPLGGLRPGVVSGTVVETSTGRRLAGAYVALIGSDTVGVSADGLSTTTRDDGTFLFGRVDPGDYTLRASSPGYKANARTIRVYAMSSRSYQLTLTQDNARCPTVIAGKPNPACRGSVISGTDRTSQKSP